MVITRLECLLDMLGLSEWLCCRWSCWPAGAMVVRDWELSTNSLAAAAGSPDTGTCRLVGEVNRVAATGSLEGERGGSVVSRFPPGAGDGLFLPGFLEGSVEVQLSIDLLPSLPGGIHCPSRRCSRGSWPRILRRHAVGCCRSSDSLPPAVCRQSASAGP